MKGYIKYQGSNGDIVSTSISFGDISIHRTAFCLVQISSEQAVQQFHFTLRTSIKQALQLVVLCTHKPERTYSMPRSKYRYHASTGMAMITPDSCIGASDRTGKTEDLATPFIDLGWWAITPYGMPEFSFISKKGAEWSDFLTLLDVTA